MLSRTPATLTTVLRGFAASILVSLQPALPTESSTTTALAIHALLVVTQLIPKVALAPILISAFDANDAPCIIVAFFPLVVAADLSVVGTVAAEFVGADAGLGTPIQTSMAFFRTPLAFGAMVILALLGIVLFQAVSLTERLLFPRSSRAERPALST